MVDLLLDRADRTASTEAHRADAALFRDLHDKGVFWNGRCFDLKEDFHELKHPDFWSAQLTGLAEEVLEGGLGRDWPTHRRLGTIAHGVQWAHFFELRAKQLSEQST